MHVGIDCCALTPLSRLRRYRSGGLFPPTSLKPQVTEAQYRAIMRKKAGLGTHTFLIDRPYS